MSGKIIPAPPEPHKCEGRPPADGYPAGTRWVCDDCGLDWIVVWGAQYNEPYSAWRITSSSPISGESRGRFGPRRDTP